MSGNFYARYVAKYALKAEPGAQLQMKDQNLLYGNAEQLSEVQKYMNMRVVCFTEMADNMFEHPCVRQKPQCLFIDLQLPENRYRYYNKR